MTTKKNLWENKSNDEILASYLFDYKNIKPRVEESQGLAAFEALALDILKNKKYSDINYHGSDKRTFWNLAINNAREESILHDIFFSGADISIENELGRCGFVTDKYSDNYLKKVLIDNLTFVHFPWSVLNDQQKNLVKSIHANTFEFLVDNNIVQHLKSHQATSRRKDKDSFATYADLKVQFYDTYFNLDDQMKKLDEMCIDSISVKIKVLYSYLWSIKQDMGSEDELLQKYSKKINSLWSVLRGDEKAKVFIDVLGIGDTASKIKSFLYDNENYLLHFDFTNIQFDDSIKSKKKRVISLLQSIDTYNQAGYSINQNKNLLKNIENLVSIAYVSNMLTQQEIMTYCNNIDVLKSTAMNTVMNLKLTDADTRKTSKAKI